MGCIFKGKARVRYEFDCMTKTLDKGFVFGLTPEHLKILTNPRHPKRPDCGIDKTGVRTRSTRRSLTPW